MLSGFIVALPLKRAGYKMIDDFNPLLFRNLTNCMSNFFRKHWPDLIAAMIFLGALQVLLWPCNPQQSWGGDYAGYIGQARQVVEGKPIRESYYIYNPALPYLAPPAYPMGFPMVLAPLYAMFGLDLMVFVQFVTVTWWMTGLVLFFMLRKHFSTPVSTGASLLLLFNPYMFAAKNAILPDHLFTCWLLLSAYWYVHNDRSKIKNALICGFLAGLAWITRANGVVLLLAFFTDVFVAHIGLWMKQRKFGIIQSDLKFLAIVSGMAAGIQFFIHGICFELPKGGSYFDQFVFGDSILKILRANLDTSLTILFNFFQLEPEMPFGIKSADIAARLGGAVALGFTLTGLVVAAGKVFRFYRILLLVFVSVLVVWPLAQGLRYLVPAIPLLIIFCVAGIQSVKAEGSVTNSIKWLLIPLLLYGEYYRLDEKIGEKNLLEDVGAPQHESNRQAYRYVRDSMPADAILAYHHPLILGLYARKKSMHWGRHENSETVLNEFRAFSVQYVLVNNWLLEADDPLKRFIKDYGNLLTEVWRNERNVLYQLK